jgi:hypothetical protein
MDLRRVIGLPKGVLRDLGNAALKLCARGKPASSGRKECVRRPLGSAPQSGVWSDFNRANAKRLESSSILHGTLIEGAIAEPLDLRQLKTSLTLLLAAPLAVCVCGILVAYYHPHRLTALASTLGTKLVRRVYGHSALQQVTKLPDPRLLPILVLPDPVVTPGEALNLSLPETKKIGSRPTHLSNVSAEVKGAVFGGYGLSVDERNYEIDHLIPLSLGGANSTKNLWPHSRKGSFWTVEKKVALEKRLYRLVRAGRLPLLTARQEIASNWAKAYRKYIDKTAPLLVGRGPDKSPISAAQGSSKNWH